MQKSILKALPFLLLYVLLARCAPRHSSNGGLFFGEFVAGDAYASGCIPYEESVGGSVQETIIIGKQKIQITTNNFSDRKCEDLELAVLGIVSYSKKGWSKAVESGEKFELAPNAEAARMVAFTQEWVDYLNAKAYCGEDWKKGVAKDTTKCLPGVGSRRWVVVYNGNQMYLGTSDENVDAEGYPKSVDKKIVYTKNN